MDKETPDSDRHCSVLLEPADHASLASLCGPYNQHLRQLENYFGVDIRCRGNRFSVVGAQTGIYPAAELIKSLYASARKELLNAEAVHLHIQQFAAQGEDSECADKRLCQVKTWKGVFTARSGNQIRYLQSINRHDISFGIGPAGTGKTFLAVAAAAAALRQSQIRKLVLVRPAVEAGEKLGFLPGDIIQKIDPYFRPIYDALYDTLGHERLNKLMENQIVEVAPLAYMRGRSLNHSFIILDEAQNTTVEQMKMFLTRTGFGSRVVVNGDITQIDLPDNRRSGLSHVLRVVKGVDGIGFTFFQSKDVIRHPLVRKIIKAYEVQDESDCAEGSARPRMPSA